MKKLFTLFTAVMLVFALGANAQSRKTWDFRHWTASTLEALKVDMVTNGPDKNWRNYESDPSKADEQHYWVARKMAGTLVTNDGEGDKNIPETDGLIFGASGQKKLVISYNHSNKGENGGSFIWLNGKKEKITVPEVQGNQTLHIAIESHSASEARGVTMTFAGTALVSPTGNFTPIEYTEYDVDLPEGQGDLVITSTNGCHIYYLIFGEGDAQKESKIGYLYYDAAGDGFESLPLYQAISGMEGYTYEGVNMNSKIPTKEELMAYDAVVLDGSVPANDEIVKALQPNMYWQPVVNFNPALAVAMGYGESLAVESSTSYVLDNKKSWFADFKDYGDGENGHIYWCSNEVVMPVPLKLTAHAKATPYIVCGEETDVDPVALKDSVIGYVYNSGHNAYIYYGLTGDYYEGTDVILKAILKDAASSKAEVAECPAPAFTPGYREMETTVAISALNKNAVIYYTTDGSDPTMESKVYSEPLVFTAEATVKAVAIADGYLLSDVKSFDVKLHHQAKVPTISVSGDEKTEDATITLASEEGDAVNIWYNFTGSHDTVYSSKYIAPVTIKHAATISFFAVPSSEESALVKSDLVEADVKANMLNVRRDQLAHFTGDTWNTLDNLVLDGQPQTKWTTSNYYFTWGKTAQKSVEETEDPIMGEDGKPIVDEEGNLVYNTKDMPVSVTENTADTDWKITSRGQVMIFQGNTLGSVVGDFNNYNPERAEDLIENLATKNCIQFGGIASGDKATATIESTKTFEGKLSIVAVVANVKGNKTTGIAEPCKVAIQVSADGANWETVGDTLTTGKIYRNYTKFEELYDAEVPVYVRLISVSGVSQAVHDIYVFNHGEKSAAAEEDYKTGVEEVEEATSVTAGQAIRVLKNGQVLIIKDGSVFTVAGAKIK